MSNTFDKDIISYDDGLKTFTDKVNDIVQQIIDTIGTYPSLKDFIQNLSQGFKGTVVATPTGVTVTHNFGDLDYICVVTPSTNLKTWAVKNTNQCTIYAETNVSVDYLLVNTTDALKVIQSSPNFLISFFQATFSETAFVMKGCASAKDATKANQLDVDGGIVYFSTGLGLPFPALQFTTSVPSTTYYLDYVADGTSSWDVTHSSNSTAVPICSVTTDAQANILTVTDLRPLNVNVLTENNLKPFMNDLTVKTLKATDPTAPLQLPVLSTLPSTPGPSGSFVVVSPASGSPILYECDGTNYHSIGVIPIASSSVVGGIKAGATLAVDANGLCNVVTGQANGIAGLDDTGHVLTSQLPPLNYIPLSSEGVANGVATLDGSGFVYPAQLNYAVLKTLLGVANGVATLDSNTKVPVAQIPPLSYISTSQQGVANGVATLDSQGKVIQSQLPVSRIRYWTNV